MAYYTTHTGRQDGAARAGFYLMGGKRILDIALVLMFLPLWLPLVLVLWVLAWLGSGSGLYIDERVGRGGRIFGCLKIRTMPLNTPRGCASIKVADDPRITLFGRVLRRTSLDELPQLWCVLKGEMSLIGPRPVPELELRRYGAQKPAYLKMRPGVSGLWQVSGRNACSYKERIALDVEYSRSACIWLDLKIIGASVLEVFRLSGR